MEGILPLPAFAASIGFQVVEHGKVRLPGAITVRTQKGGRPWASLRSGGRCICSYSHRGPLCPELRRVRRCSPPDTRTQAESPRGKQAPDAHRPLCPQFGAASDDIRQWDLFLSHMPPPSAGRSGKLGRPRKACSRSMSRTPRDPRQARWPPEGGPPGQSARLLCPGPIRLLPGSAINTNHGFTKTLLASLATAQIITDDYV